MTAFGGLGTDDAKASQVIYSINSPKLYYAVLWTVQNSSSLRREYGKRFKLVGEFLSEDMSYAAGQKGGYIPGGTRDVQSPGAAIQQLTGSDKQYRDYERHLKQFNLNEFKAANRSNHQHQSNAVCSSFTDSTSRRPCT